MTRYVLAALLRARVRVVSLAVGVLVVAVSFSLLTATTSTTQGEVRGDVASAGRPAYDILVRPAGVAAATERREEVVPANFQSGIFGGISVAQWRTIQAVSGVAAAAPVANLGYVMPTTDVTVPLSDLVDPSATEQVLKAQVSYQAQAGTTSYPAESDFVYVTRLPEGCADKAIVPLSLPGPFELRGPGMSFLTCFQYGPSPRDGSPCFLQIPFPNDGSTVCDPQVRVRVPFPCWSRRSTRSRRTHWLPCPTRWCRAGRCVRA